MGPSEASKVARCAGADWHAPDDWKRKVVEASLIVCLIRAKLPSLSNHLPLTSEGACGDPFASAPWQPIQVPSAGLAVEADPHIAPGRTRDR